MTDSIGRFTHVDDRDISISEMLDFTPTRHVSVQACTVAGGSHENEDAYVVFSADSLLALAVFDGASSHRPIPALGQVTGARFASHLLRDRLPTCDLSIPPREILLDLNRQLLDASTALGGALDDTHSLPASCATLVVLDPTHDRLSFAHLGDTFLIVENDLGDNSLLTVNRVAPFDAHFLDLIRQVADEQHLSVAAARHTPAVSTVMRETHAAKRNAPDGSGYGILNGHPAAELYIQDGELPLHTVQTLILGSDGLPAQGVELDDPASLRDFVVLAKQGTDALIAAKQASEDTDPERHFTRYKHSDDATAIVAALQHETLG